MIASLPMYDRPETRAANDRLWSAIRAHLREGPAELTREDDLWSVCCAPELLLAQACGLPYRTELHARVDIVGTPTHPLDCPSGHYYSVLVVRVDDPRNEVAAFVGARFATNALHSQSGWGALWPLIAPLEPQAPTVTGSHRASAEAVAGGKAALAAIDAVTWEMICRWDDAASRLRVLQRTKPTPALPFVTAKGNDVSALRAALAKGIAALSEEDRDMLLLDGIVQIDPGSYMELAVPPMSCHFD